MPEIVRQGPVFSDERDSDFDRLSGHVDQRGKFALESDFFLGRAKTLRAGRRGCERPTQMEKSRAILAERLILTPVDLPFDGAAGRSLALLSEGPAPSDRP